MARQNSIVLSSSANLRTSIAAIRAAVGSGTFDALKAALTASASALEQAQGAIDGLEQRLRELGQLNVNVPGRRAPLLVSADRVQGAATLDRVTVSYGPAPMANPPSAGVLYVDEADGILKFHGSAGTVTPLANP